MRDEGYVETSTTSVLFRWLGSAMAITSVGVAAALATVPPPPGREPSASDFVVSSITVIVAAALGSRSPAHG